MEEYKKDLIQSSEALDMTPADSAYLIFTYVNSRVTDRVSKLEGRAYRGSTIKVVAKSGPTIIEGEYSFLRSIFSDIKDIDVGTVRNFSGISDISEYVRYRAPDSALMDRVEMTMGGEIKVASGNLVLNLVYSDNTPAINSPKTNIFLQGAIATLDLRAIKTERILNLAKLDAYRIFVPASAQYSKLVLPAKAGVVQFEEGCSLSKVQFNPRVSAAILLPNSMKNSVLDFSLN